MKNLRDFLEHRERELAEQLAEQKRRAIPFEAELTDIKEAKKALGIGVPGVPQPTLLSPINGLREFLDRRERELRESINGLGAILGNTAVEFEEVRRVKATIGLEYTKEFAVGDSSVDDPLTQIRPEIAGAVPYQSLTIAELIVRAFKQHFVNGANISHLLAFFGGKWGRQIDKQSLSPQLSRLFRRGAIGRIRSSQRWFLIRPELRFAGQRPYMRAGVIVWMDKEGATQTDEPLITREIDGSDDRMPYMRSIFAGIGGLLLREQLLWLLPHEVLAGDAPALRFQVPTPDDD